MPTRIAWTIPASTTGFAWPASAPGSDALLASRAPASMGLAVYPRDGDDGETLQRVAAGLYVAKRRRSRPGRRTGEPLRPGAVSGR